MNKYIGHPSQIYGVEQMRLVGGKADGMRIYRVRNGKGLDFEISLDRCGDISKLSVSGDNFAFVGPCGYVSPKFYNPGNGKGFLKSFSAGFFTTCGLENVGVPCELDGEVLPLHGNISNVPCENAMYYEENNEIHIKLTIRDASLFGHHLIIEREYVCPLDKNAIYLTDTIKNVGNAPAEVMIMYHCNMGYPLLSENAMVTIPSVDVVPRDDEAADGFDRCTMMEKPQNGYKEKCYFHKLIGKPTVSIYNPDIKKGMNMTYNTDELGCFTEWKMMGEYEYVLGLEPGNCVPCGRIDAKEQGMVDVLLPDEEKTNHIMFEFV